MEKMENEMKTVGRGWSSVLRKLSCKLSQVSITVIILTCCTYMSGHGFLLSEHEFKFLNSNLAAQRLVQTRVRPARRVPCRHGRIQ